MVFKCCVAECSNTSSSTSVFSFPRDCELREKWLNAIGISEKNITTTTKVCAAHFPQEKFHTFSTCRKLKKGVIPTFFLKQMKAVTAEDKSDFIHKNFNRKRKIRYLFTKTPSQFSIVNFMHNDKKIYYYTGLKTYRVFYIIFKIVTESERTSTKSALLPIDEFFLTLMRIRRGCDYKILADMFGIRAKTVSRIFLGWINLIYYKLGECLIWPHRDILMKHAPKLFLENHPNVLGSVVCIEFFTRIPRSSVLEKLEEHCYYSNCETKNTLKSLSMIDANGRVIFVSTLFSVSLFKIETEKEPKPVLVPKGSISDQEIMKKSGFNNLLKLKIEKNEIIPSDIILTDKGFRIADLLLVNSETLLNIPTFKMSQIQLLEPNNIVEYIREIAKGRLHVERAIQRIKSFILLSAPIPVSHLEFINQICTVSALLTNFRA